MTKLKIDDEILRKTTKCGNGFTCLSGDDKCLNDIEDSVGHAVCFVRCNSEDCSYYVSHGFLGAVCSCPTRVEIFKRYRK